MKATETASFPFLVVMRDPLPTLPKVVLLLLFFVAALQAEVLPGKLQGTWRINRVLPTSNSQCWNQSQANALLGSSLTYSQSAMRWKGGSIQLLDINTRLLSAADFERENRLARFSQLGIRNDAVTEVDMQHDDMDITGSTTEVPGDSVLLAGPNRIVVSACGVYFEATRSLTSISKTAFKK